METQKETFRKLLVELREEVYQEITDVFDETRKMCLEAIDSALDCLDIPQCKGSIHGVIRTVRILLRQEEIEK